MKHICVNTPQHAAVILESAVSILKSVLYYSASCINATPFCTRTQLISYILKYSLSIRWSWLLNNFSCIWDWDGQSWCLKEYFYASIASFSQHILQTQPYIYTKNSKETQDSCTGKMQHSNTNKFMCLQKYNKQHLNNYWSTMNDFTLKSFRAMFL